jgi:hypothetical protein
MKDKLLLSIKETSDLFGIGQHRLRDIIREDYDCKYHLMVGRVIKIKCLSLFDNHHKIRLYRCYVYNKFIFY